MKSILQKDLWSITSFLENKEYNFNKENILTQLPEKFIDEAINEISSWDNYAPTPLIKLNKLNDELKFQNIYYKDEDKRFELKSFKALGGAFAVYKIASEKKKHNSFDGYSRKSWKISCMGRTKTRTKM